MKNQPCQKTIGKFKASLLQTLGQTRVLLSVCSSQKQWFLLHHRHVVFDIAIDPLIEFQHFVEVDLLKLLF